MMIYYTRLGESTLNDSITSLSNKIKGVKIWAGVSDVAFTNGDSGALNPSAITQNLISRGKVVGFMAFAENGGYLNEKYGLTTGGDMIIVGNYGTITLSMMFVIFYS